MCVCVRIHVCVLVLAMDSSIYIAHHQYSLISMGNPLKNSSKRSGYTSMESYERYSEISCSISISLDESKLTLSQVKDNPNLTLLCPDVELSAEVDVYKSVMGKDCTLINSAGLRQIFRQRSVCTCYSKCT